MFTCPHMHIEFMLIFCSFKCMTDPEFFNPNINVNIWGNHHQASVAGGACRAYFLRWMWIKASAYPFLYFWPYRSIGQHGVSLMGKIPSYICADEISAWNINIYLFFLIIFFFSDMSKWLTKCAKDVLKKASLAVLFFLESIMSSKWWQTAGCWTLIGWMV